jgi:hypothetical protein
MVLEGTVICVDNSDFMRNGDVAPSRMQARAGRTHERARTHTCLCPSPKAPDAQTGRTAAAARRPAAHA